MKKFFGWLIIAATMGLFLASAAPAKAAWNWKVIIGGGSGSSGTPIEPGNLNGLAVENPGTTTGEDLPTLLNQILIVVVSVAGSILIVMLVIAGVQYLTGAGNEEQVTKAKKMMLNAIIGLIVTVAAYAIATFVIGALQ